MACRQGWLLVAVLGLSCMLSASEGSASEAAKGAGLSQQEMNERLIPFAEYLNEFSERRRLNAYFPNQQTVLYGAQVGYVNVGRGNFTFLRRDLVTAGRVPLVAARVYDSSFAGGDDFGPGWLLTLAEAIRPQADGRLELLDECANHVRLAPVGKEFRVQGSAPTDILSAQLAESGKIVVQYRTGLRKTFVLQGALYRLALVSDRNGNTLTLKYASGRLQTVRNGSGRLLNFTRDASGRIVSLSDDKGRTVAYSYSDDGLLSEAVDAGGNSWAYRYDKGGRLIEASDPANTPNFTVAYDGAGRAARLQSPGLHYNYRYQGSTTFVTDGNDSVSSYRQNDDGITVSLANAIGHQSSISLDDSGRVTELHEGPQLKASLNYGSHGRLLSLKRFEGSQQQSYFYHYDEQGRLIGVLGARQSREGGESVYLRLAYDQAGNLTEREDASGTAFFVYSERGDLTESVGKEGHAYRFEYDAHGQMTSVTDAQGRRTAFEYDPLGKLARTVFADGSSNSYRYTELGMRQSTQYDFGAIVEYSHLPSGSLIETRITNHDGRIAGNRFTFDEEQRTSSVAYSRGTTIFLDYDAMGNLMTARTPEKAVQFRYDSLNRFVEAVTTSGERLSYIYEDGEADLRVQLDSKSGVVRSSRVAGGSTFGTFSAIWRNRAERSEFGAVAFDAATSSYRLASPLGAVVDDPLSALKRMRILELGAARHEDKLHFEQPSNIMFIPAEYRRVNCCPDCDWVLDLCDCFYEIEPIEICYECGPPPYTGSPIPCNMFIQVNSSPSNFRITSTPSMPNVTANAFNTPGGASINWTARITYTSGVGCSGGPGFNSPNRTGTGFSFSPNFGGFYGGNLRITATCSGPDIISDFEEQNFEVGGNDPGGPAIYTEIGTVSSPLDSNDLRRIACQESSQQQFYSSGLPVLGTGGDAGIMQICYQRVASDFWNWKSNISRGRGILNSSLSFANQVPNRVRTNVVRGMGPFPNATNFTNSQTRLEAIHRYNAGTDWDLGYWEWNNSMGQWVADPQGGTAGYANSVVGRSPSC